MREDPRSGQPVVGPKPSTHYSVGRPCSFCGQPFQPGEYTTFVLRPWSDSFVGLEVHTHCEPTDELLPGSDVSGRYVFFHVSDRKAPEVRAKLTRKGLEVKCPYCQETHKHGAGEGHRMAHCCKEVGSPYLETGYVLRV